MEDAYSSREIDLIMKGVNDSVDGIKDHLDERMDVFESNTSTALDEIRKQNEATIAQTTKTNGRVSELETQQRIMRARINTVIWLGGFIIASVLIPIVAAYISRGGL